VKNLINTKIFGDRRSIIIISFSIFFVYFNSLFNPFIWDDLYLIVKNPFIKNFKFFHFYFTKGIFAGAFPYKEIKFYRPLQSLSYSIIYHISGLKPFSFHLFNILLHILNSILLFKILSEIFEKKIAFFSSLLFGIHPLNTEAITYISGTADPLFFFFCLLSIIFFLRGKYFLSYLFFVFSLLSKEMGLITPFYLLVILYGRGEENKKNLKMIVPFFLIIILYVIFRFNFTNVSQKISIHFKYRFLTSFKSFLYYLSLILSPYKLHMERSLRWVLRFTDIGFLSGFFVFIFSIFLVFKFKRNRKFIFPYLLFLINFFTVSGILVQLNANFSEHFIYSGIIGILIYLPLLLKKFIKKEKIFTFLLCILCLIYGIRSILRNFDWKNPEKFFEKTGKEANYPKRVKDQLAFILLNKGNYKKAYEILKNEVEKNPDDEDISLNYGASLIRLGKYQKAEEVYKKILKINPENYEVFHDLAIIYEKKKDYQKAKKYLLKAIEINPYYAEGYYQLGKINYIKGEIKKAEEYLEKSIEIDPDYAYSYNLLGIIYTKRNPEKTFLYFKKAVEIEPENILFIKNFALICRNTGRIKLAIKYYRKALQLKPDSPDILNDIGICYAMKRNKKKAIEMWKKALNIKQNYKPAIENLEKIQKRE